MYSWVCLKKVLGYLWWSSLLKYIFKGRGEISDFLNRQVKVGKVAGFQYVIITNMKQWSNITCPTQLRNHLMIFIQFRWVSICKPRILYLMNLLYIFHETWYLIFCKVEELIHIFSSFSVSLLRVIKCCHRNAVHYWINPAIFLFFKLGNKYFVVRLFVLCLEWITYTLWFCAVLFS